MVLIKGNRCRLVLSNFVLEISEINVLVGNFRVNPPDLDELRRTAIAHEHEDFEVGKYYNDIAVLELPEAVPYDKVLPLCPEGSSGSFLAACGMGQIDSRNNFPDVERKLFLLLCKSFPFDSRPWYAPPPPPVAPHPPPP